MNCITLPIGRPFLAFTRKWGWVVLHGATNEIVPRRAHGGNVNLGRAYTRPNSHEVSAYRIRAIAELPPVPPEAAMSDTDWPMEDPNTVRVRWLAGEIHCNWDLMRRPVIVNGVLCERLSQLKREMTLALIARSKE